MELSQCPCCLRHVRDIDMTIHHWLPRSQGGTLKETIILCKTCHETLHYIIDIADVVKYKTVDELESHPQFCNYLHWIRAIDHPSHVNVKQAYKASCRLPGSKPLQAAG